jgi:hypothetical protein
MNVVPGFGKALGLRHVVAWKSSPFIGLNFDWQGSF